MKKSTLVIALALLLAGCAFPATKEGMAVTNYTAPKQTGERIFVKESTGGSITLPFWMSKIPNDNFTEAVKESLLNSKAFSTLSANWADDWGLEIEIISVRAEGSIQSLTVTTGISYTLYLKGQKVYQTDIRESATCGCGSKFSNNRLANEISARLNIWRFIEELSKTNLN